MSALKSFVVASNEFYHYIVLQVCIQKYNKIVIWSCYLYLKWEQWSAKNAWEMETTDGRTKMHCHLNRFETRYIIALYDDKRVPLIVPSVNFCHSVLQSSSSPKKSPTQNKSCNQTASHTNKHVNATASTHLSTII